MRPVALLGSGLHFPRRKVHAAEIESTCGLNPGSVAARTGVETRHFASAAAGETASSLGAEAAREALGAAGLRFADVDLLLGAAGTSQQPIPCTAALIQRALGEGESGKPAFDVNCTCLSFVAALDVAASLIAAGTYRRILIVSSEVGSPGLDWRQAETSALFGDGAAAFVVGPANDPGQGIVHAKLATYGTGADHCRIEGGGTALHATACHKENRPRFLFQMDGPAIHREASRRLPPFVKSFLREADTDLGSIDIVVPHQAGLLPIEIIRRKLGIAQERLIVTLADHGNLIAASIPAALHLAIQAGQVRRGQRVLLLGTSAGFSMGALLLQY
jgi:3-oxoacyl-[acyl-carrier-protein] synthase-3